MLIASAMCGLDGVPKAPVSCSKGLDGAPEAPVWWIATHMQRGAALRLRAGLSSAATPAARM